MLNLFKYIIIPDKAFKFEGEYGLNLCTKHDAWGMQESKTHRFLALENYTLKIKSLNYFPVVQQKRIHCQCRRLGFDPWVRKIPWRRKWQPTPVFLPGEIPWPEKPGRLLSMGGKELDMTEQLNNNKKLYSAKFNHILISISRFYSIP